MSRDVTPYPGLIENYTDGENVVLGGFTFILPPMKLKTLKTMMRSRLIDRAASAASTDWTQPDAASDAFSAGIDSVIEMLAMSLKRNYPDITIEILEDLLDVEDVNRAVEAVLLVNKLSMRPTMGEAPVTPNGATTASPTPDSGSTSNAGSPAPSAGLAN